MRTLDGREIFYRNLSQRIGAAGFLRSWPWCHRDSEANKSPRSENGWDFPAGKPDAKSTRIAVSRAAGIHGLIPSTANASGRNHGNRKASFRKLRGLHSPCVKFSRWARWQFGQHATRIHPENQVTVSSCRVLPASVWWP